MTKKHDFKPGDRVLVTQVAGDDEGLHVSGTLIYLEDALKFLAKHPDSIEGIDLEEITECDPPMLEHDGIIVLTKKERKLPQVVIFMNPEGRHPHIFVTHGGHGFWAMFLVEPMTGD